MPKQDLNKIIEDYGGIQEQEPFFLSMNNGKVFPLAFYIFSARLIVDHFYDLFFSQSTDNVYFPYCRIFLKILLVSEGNQACLYRVVVHNVDSLQHNIAFSLIPYCSCTNFSCKCYSKMF